MTKVMSEVPSTSHRDIGYSCRWRHRRCSSRSHTDDAANHHIDRLQQYSLAVTNVLCSCHTPQCVDEADRTGEFGFSVQIQHANRWQPR